MASIRSVSYSFLKGKGGTWQLIKVVAEIASNGVVLSVKTEEVATGSKDNDRR